MENEAYGTPIEQAIQKARSEYIENGEISEETSSRLWSQIERFTKYYLTVYHPIDFEEIDVDLEDVVQAVVADQLAIIRDNEKAVDYKRLYPYEKAEEIYKDKANPHFEAFKSLVDMHKRNIREGKGYSTHFGEKKSPYYKTVKTVPIEEIDESDIENKSPTPEDIYCRKDEIKHRIAALEEESKRLEEQIVFINQSREKLYLYIRAYCEPEDLLYALAVEIESEEKVLSILKNHGGEAGLPSLKEVERCYQAFETFKLVQRLKKAGNRINWSKISRIMGIDYRTAKKRYNQGREINNRLKNNKVGTVSESVPKKRYIISRGS